MACESTARFTSKGRFRTIFGKPKDTVEFMTEYPFHRFSTLAVAAFLVSLALSDSPARLTLKDA